MATLKNTTITNLSVDGDAVCNSSTAANTTAHLSSRPNISSSYSTTGVINFTGEVDLLKSLEKSGGRFTALHSGLYMILYANISQNDGATNRVYVRVNGGRISQARGEGLPSYPMVNAMHVAYLYAGDFVEVELGTGTIYLTTSFTGFLIHRIF